MLIQPALLEEQARRLEGGDKKVEPAPEAGPSRSTLPQPFKLNSLFMGYESSPIANSTIQPESTRPSVPLPEASPPTCTTVNPQIAEPTSLDQVLDRFLANEKTLAESSQSGREATMTEDGLPIHEIRETPSGEIIGAIPEPTVPDDQEQGKAEDGEGGEDYWSEAAVARRAALRKKVFGDSDEELEETDDEDEPTKVESEVDRPTVSLQASTPTSPRKRSSNPVSTLTPSPPSSPRSSPTLSPSRRPSASVPPPTRSILKPPPQPVRKKSVTFDESVPLPPESPDMPGPPSTLKMGFQLPLPGSGPDDSEFGVKSVPVIQKPVPGVKKEGFGGMKRGFLDPPSRAGVGKADPNPVEPAPEGKKKPSLFAQRMASQVVKESPVVTAPASAPAPKEAEQPVASTSRHTNLPKMSDTSSTSSVRPIVVEKPTAPSSTPASSSASSSRQPKTYPTAEEEEDEEDEDIGFLDDDDDDEEDEYNLDDALLAREVALEYHRRRAYTSPYISQDPDDPAYGQLPPLTDDEQGGVMLAMPQVSSNGTGGAPTIVNPTPDDFRRYVRVGKLENGNLVLAPGEEGWSDDEEGEGEQRELELERRKKRDNRRKVKEALMGREADTGKEESVSGPARRSGVSTIPKASALSPRISDSSLPPTIQSASAQPTTPAVSAVKERIPAPPIQSSTADPPKRVSRFKAARMGNT